MDVTVREVTMDDILLINKYWQDAGEEHLKSMGADPDLQPDPVAFHEMLNTQISKDYSEKQSYCIVWLLNDAPVGHCNVNQIVFGQEAHMHLHLWDAEKRQSGLGAAFVKLSIPYFFKNLQLQTLFCEPYALNDAPNATLAKLGFQFVEEYVTTPGAYSFEQPVKKWKLTADRWPF
jgi:RimJ/RimL family protein N-acetyltransferase